MKAVFPFVQKVSDSSLLVYLTPEAEIPCVRRSELPSGISSSALSSKNWAWIVALLSHAYVALVMFEVSLACCIISLAFLPIYIWLTAVQRTSMKLKITIAL